jgi:uncharacterized OsmC-like protein
MQEGEFKVRVELEEKYKFRIGFNGDGVQDIYMDEPRPLGDGAYPNAGKFLAAAVGNCLCASLTFCVNRTHTEMLSLRAEVFTTMGRNEQGRLRITHIKVNLYPELSDPAKLRLCQDVFEDFCIVSQSVKKGIPTEVNIYPVGEKEQSP